MIAWNEYDDAEVATILSDSGFSGVEAIPSRVLDQAGSSSKQRIVAYREQWEDSGLLIPSMQALLFGTRQIPISQPPHLLHGQISHMKRVAEAGSALGVKRYVYGSPQTRKYSVGQDPQDWPAYAASFFGEIAKIISQNDGLLCIEANPKFYGAEFLCTSRDVVNFVRTYTTGSVGFNFDVGASLLNKEDPASMIYELRDYISHVHLSEPNLESLSCDTKLYPKIFEALSQIDYGGYVSIEMKKPSGGLSTIARIASKIKRLSEI
jgi:sugar phosphate isomerase/epimerase